MTDDLPRTTFTELAQRTGLIPDAELDDFWTTLEPASIEWMFGEWKSGEVNTGHRINGILPKANWFGRTIKSATDVLPIVCLDDDGNKFNNLKLAKGEASCGWKSFAVR